MKTKKIEDFYNTNLQENITTYEQRRWFESSQKKAGYYATLNTIKKYVPSLIAGGKNVLEVGPGPGTWTKVLLQEAPTARYDLVDISKEMLSQAEAALGKKDNVNFVVSDILSFHPARQYDLFFSSRMIEYVPEKDPVVATIARSLVERGSGFIITKTPQYSRLFSRVKKSEIHNYQISPNDFEVLLAKHGLQVEKMIHATYVFPLVRIGFLDSALFHFCKFLPFSWTKFFSESYAVVFKKV